MSVVRIAHLSDPHFGTIAPGVQDGLLETLLTLKTDLVLLTGDITQRARHRQFAQAHRFAENIREILPESAVIAVPGNHDIPLFNIFGRFFDPYRGFRKVFKFVPEKDFRRGDIVITALNSTSRWRHVQGDLSPKRTEERLKQKEQNAKIRIVAFHHPMDCRQPHDEKNLLKNRDQIFKLFESHQIDLVVGGHIHDPFVRLSNQRYPDGQRSMVLSVAGTCLSRRIRPGAPNSFNFIEADTGSNVPRLTISRYDVRADLRFTPEKVSHFQRSDSENGWTHYLD